MAGHSYHYISVDVALKYNPQIREIAEELNVSKTDILGSLTSLFILGLEISPDYGNLQEINEEVLLANLNDKRAKSKKILKQFKEKNFIETDEKGRHTAIANWELWQEQLSKNAVITIKNKWDKRIARAKEDRLVRKIDDALSLKLEQTCPKNKIDFVENNLYIELDKELDKETNNKEQGLKGLDLKENKKPDEAPKPDVVSNSFYSTQTQDLEPEAKSIKNDYQKMEIAERRKFFNDKDFEIDENGKCIKNRNILKEFHAEGKNLIEIYVKNIDPKRTGDTMNPCDTMLLQIARHGLGAVKDMVYAYQRYLNTAPSSESVVGVRNFFENGKYVQYIGKCGLKPKTPESRMFAALERTGLTHGLANEILTIDKSTTELFIKAGLNREELEGVFTNTYTDLERTESNFEQILIKHLKAINA